jgi:uncharacterized damage-inducible protein DinB
MADALVELFEHNLWANIKMLDACIGLDEQQLKTSAQGTFGQIGDTLAHMVAAEGRYVARLEGKQPDDAHHERHGGPGVAVLRKRVQESGEALVRIAREFDSDNVLRGTWRGEPYEMRAFIPLIQAINHATEHRSQVATILTQLGIQPPQMDVWTFADERGYA